MTTATSPRYTVRIVRPLWPHSRFVVWDNLKGTYLDQLYRKRHSANKRCDKLNATALRKADAYRKAKDNG